MNPPTATATAPVLGRVPARDRLALALDVPDRDAAMALVERFGADFGVMKVGLELFIAEGPALVRDIVSAGSRVFLDLKLHDIPNTVEHAARRAGALGVWLLTLHTQGGLDMVTAGVRGLREGAADARRGAADAAASAADAGSVAAAAGTGAAAPIALGVTVLTSDPHAVPELLKGRARLAEQAGCGGVVCAAPDLGVVTDSVPGMLRVVPGIRPAGAPSADQRRVATPASALAAGADVLVIGRAVTAALDPDAAAAAIVAEVTAELAGD